MSRCAREIYPNIPYHVLNRGNNHQQIFFKEEDYHFFYDALGRAKRKYPCKIYSYVLMTNHFHVLIEAQGEAENIALAMKHVCQRYVQYINRHYKRSGCLWEGRFKGSPVSTDLYLLACSRYIEMNPVRACLVEQPGDYEYSSYKAKTGNKDQGIITFDPLYLNLGETEDERQEKYRKWFMESMPEHEINKIRDAIQRNWAYGNSVFRESMEEKLRRRFVIRRSGRKPREREIS